MSKRNLFAVVRVGCYVAVLCVLTYQLIRHRADVVPVVASLGWGRWWCCLPGSAPGKPCGGWR